MKIKSIIILLIICLILSSNVFALSDIFTQADNFISTGKGHTNETMDTTTLKNASDDIYNALLGAGVGIAVIVGAIFGIQFMTAGIDAKVKVKESLVAYVISCIVLFGTFGIWKLIVTILSGV